MKYFVYLIITKRINKIISYVGYTNDLKKRLKLHNASKGAKFTKGNKWLLIYKKSYLSKRVAMRAEYKLKKNYNFRTKLKSNYLKK
jgi:putative endonuclease|tara:strand:+ start:1082 stop:1339 length:258 start_codon:yes stop_codon:yes gene_type:complete